MSEVGNTEKMPVLNEQNSDNNNRRKNRQQPKKYYTPWYIALTVLTILVNIAFIVEMFYVTKYASLSKALFIKINVIALVVLLVMDLLVFLSIRIKKLVLLIITTCLLVSSIGVGAYAGYALLRVDKSVSDITKTEYTKSVNTSLVVYSKGSGKPIVELSDVDGANVGYATGTDTAEVGQKYLSDAGVTPNYKQYNDYTDVFKALISSEIDVAVLPGTYASIIGSDESLSSYVEDTSALETFSADVQASGVSGADKDLTKEPFTVLLTGENEGLADTIILVSVNPISMKVTMTSIARDSYVPISCYNGGKSKINAAHAVSESCMVDTVEQTTGVKIDYTVEFNYTSFVQIVDAVGGVVVNNPVTFDAQCWNIYENELAVFTIEAGDHVYLDGARALGFARERHAFADGDFARQRHQQEIIEQVIQKVMDTKDPNTYLKILQAAGDNIKTNMSSEQMVNFVSYAMKKSNRYYDSNNPASVFDILSNRITGYSVMMWDDSLSMYLYTYWLYNGSISDSYNAIERNIDMDTTPSQVGSASWSAHDTYTVPAISQDYYDEGGETTIGGPSAGSSETPVTDTQEDTTVNPLPSDTTQEPVVTPTPTPEPETPTDPTPSEPEQPSNPDDGGTTTNPGEGEDTSNQSE